VGGLYDEIRDIYRNSKYFIDKELADDFDHNVENIMSDLNHKLKIKENSELQKSCHILMGKFSLVDLCYVKLITYFYHFDKKVAHALEKIHHIQGSIFNVVMELMMNEAMKTKITVSEVMAEKEEIYKAEIRRLRTHEEEIQKQIRYFESTNRDLMDKLVAHHVKISKTERFRDLFNIQAQNANGASSSRLGPHEAAALKGRLRPLTLNQFKDVML
jgi:hypothetical protein